LQASLRGKTNLETAVEFLPRPRRPGLSLDHWLRPGPAKTDHSFAGVNNLVKEGEARTTYLEAIGAADDGDIQPLLNFARS
jgi:hypothetical protein